MSSVKIKHEVIHNDGKYYVRVLVEGRKPALLHWHGEPIEFTTEKSAREYLKEIE